VTTGADREDSHMPAILGAVLVTPISTTVDDYSPGLDADLGRQPADTAGHPGFAAGVADRDLTGVFVVAGMGEREDAVSVEFLHVLLSIRSQDLVSTPDVGTDTTLVCAWSLCYNGWLGGINESIPV